MLVCRELQPTIGLYVNRIWQPEESTLVMKLGRGDNELRLLISVDPRFYRAHLTSMTPGPGDTGPFGRLMRARFEGAQIGAVRQLDFDRRFEIDAQIADDVSCRLVCDLIGSRSNFYLKEPNGRSINRLRRIEEKVSAGVPSNLAEAIGDRRGLSKFLQEEVRLSGKEKVLALAGEGNAVWVPSVGAYGFLPSQLEAKAAVPMGSLSAALEKHYDWLVPIELAVQRAKVLKGQLQRAHHSRASAIRQMEAVLDTAARARTFQMQGEILLSNSHAIAPEAHSFEAHDYEGNPVAIKLNPKLSAVENAERLFTRAKKAKNAASIVGERNERMRSELDELRGMIDRLDSAKPDVIGEISAKAISQGWIRENAAHPDVPKEERPYAGHKIRETAAPSGHKILWGENATSNDYLTRIAKPNDYWLHVRGAGGSHVILQTQNKPERVQMGTLLFAAKVAARQSSQKHASHVPVSYTLAKHVRKPRKAAPGLVMLSHDKTLFVDP